MFSAIIHDDKFALVELFQEGNQFYVRKTVIPPRIFGFSLDFIAGYMCDREVRVLERVKGLDGVQQL